MSKKRTAADSSNDEEKNDNSDLLFPQSNHVKRAKLASLNDTTLEDLPREVIECILVKVVAMEVKDMKLVKSVWKEKADLVISRLRTVCSHWSNILTTNLFRNEVHRTLNRTAQDTIRLEILHQCQIPFHVFRFTTMKDEIFILTVVDKIIVYNRNNMAAVNDVIALPGTLAVDIVACSVSHCLYVLVRSKEGYSVLRITKEEEHQFKISTWINDLDMPYYPSISVSANGSLIIPFWPLRQNPAGVSIYDTNGCLQHKITLSPSFICLRCVDNAIKKSNGNFILLSFDDQLGEFDATGTIVRKFKSSLGVTSGAHFTDDSGWFAITELDDRIKLLDAEFNLLDFTGPVLNGSILRYNPERNEIVSILIAGQSRSVLTIFCFRDS